MLLHSNFGTALAARLRELPQQFALLVVQLARGLHQQRNAEVAAPGTPKAWHAAPV